MTLLVARMALAELTWLGRLVAEMEISKGGGAVS